MCTLEERVKIKVVSFVKSRSNRPITTVEERVKIKPHINYCINITNPHSHSLRENKTKEEIRIMLKFMNKNTVKSAVIPHQEGIENKMFPELKIRVKVLVQERSVTFFQYYTSTAFF